MACINEILHDIALENIFKYFVESGGNKVVLKLVCTYWDCLVSKTKFKHIPVSLIYKNDWLYHKNLTSFLEMSNSFNKSNPGQNSIRTRESFSEFFVRQLNVFCVCIQDPSTFFFNSETMYSVEKLIIRAMHYKKTVIVFKLLHFLKCLSHKLKSTSMNFFSIEIIVQTLLDYVIMNNQEPFSHNNSNHNSGLICPHFVFSKKCTSVNSHFVFSQEAVSNDGSVNPVECSHLNYYMHAILFLFPFSYDIFNVFGLIQKCRRYKNVYAYKLILSYVKSSDLYHNAEFQELLYFLDGFY